MRAGVSSYPTRAICNLATNPSFETASGTVEVRRNRATVPTPVAANKYQSSDGTLYGTAVYDPTGAPEGIPASKLTRTAASPGNAIGSWYAVGNTAWGAAERSPVTAGEVITLSVHAAASISGARAQISAYFFNDANGQISTIAGGLVTIPTANTWDRANVTVTVPAGATNVGATAAVVGPAGYVTTGGEVSWLSRVLFEGGSTLPPWFSGATADDPDPDLTPSWMGSAGSSASVLRGAAVAGGIVAPGHVRTFSSNQWAESGVKSVRMFGVSTNADTFIAPAGDTGALRHGMVPGRTYTVAATIHLESPQAGSLSVYARRLTLWHRGSGAYQIKSGAQAPNEAGDFESRLTFTLPPDTTEAFIRLYNGASFGNGDVWWDDLMIVEGVYNGPYRDGDSPGWGWLGAVGQSVSAGPGGL